MHIFQVNDAFCRFQSNGLLCDNSLFKIAFNCDFFLPFDVVFIWSRSLVGVWNHSSLLKCIYHVKSSSWIHTILNNKNVWTHENENGIFYCFFSKDFFENETIESNAIQNFVSIKKTVKLLAFSEFAIIVRKKLNVWAILNPL